MHQKLVTAIGVKSHDDTSSIFRNLKISKGSGVIEISSKESDSGVLWTTKLSVKLLAYDKLISDQCIIKIYLRESFYIIGRSNRPAQPTIKDGDLIELSLSYDSPERPVAIKKVLSFM